MRRQINNLISVTYTLVRIVVLKILHGSRFKSAYIQRFSPDVVLELNHGANVRFGEKIRIHSGSKIKVRAGSTLDIGSGVKINYYCIIVCRDHISIGEGTEFGPSVYLYDHDHDYRSGLKEGKFTTDSIMIGKNCWIGANTVILRGTNIGDNCVIGAGSIIKGKIEANSVVWEKRESNTSAIAYGL